MLSPEFLLSYCVPRIPAMPSPQCIAIQKGTLMHSILGLLICTFIVGGLGPSEADEGKVPEPDPKCFEWIAQYNPPFLGPSSFDKAYDLDARGNSYACVLGTNAEKVHKALKAFKDAVVFPSKATIEKGIRFPFFAGLERINSEGKVRLKISDWSEWKEFRDQYIQPRQIALIVCSSIKSLITIPDDGAMIGNGFVWLNGMGDEFGVSVMNLQSVSDEMILETCKSNY